MALLTALSAFASFRSDSAIRKIVQSQVVVQSHSRRLASAGDSLELLVHLAVLSGDPKYAAAYEVPKRDLRLTLGQLKRTVILPGNARAAQIMEQAQQSRLELDAQALHRARIGDRAGGTRILESPAYERLSTIFHQHAAAIQRRSDAYVSALRRDLDRSSLITRIASLVGIPLIALAWLLLLVPARRWGREMDRIRAEAEAATKAKGEFLATMSHEVRTPLNSILGYTELLLLDDELPAGQRRPVELIREAGSALLVVVNDILDYSAVEAGKVTLAEERFHLGSMVDNAVSIVRGQADDKGLELTSAIAPELDQWFIGDQNRLRQILLNLLNNAIKFTHHGSVQLDVCGGSEMGDLKVVHFSVRDSGIGIPAAKLSKLFDRFVQADSSVTRAYGGSGLGLSICKRLVTLMGGRIGIESTVGEGSCFWFEVPLLPATSATAPSSAEHVVQRTNGGRILLAEDVPANRELACAMLHRLGFVVDAVCNGREAVEAVRREKYDLILMDVQMPVMDGITATRAIRELAGEASATPILALTANVLPDQIHQFHVAGMDGHIAKPVQLAGLEATIARALARRVIDEPAAPPPQTGTFDAATFARLNELLPPKGVDNFLGALSRQLEAFAAARGQSAKEIAHMLVAQSGYLGFNDLSAACAAFEHGEATRAAVKAEAVLVAERITALRASLQERPGTVPAE